MKLHEKIRLIRTEKKLKVIEVYQRIQELFGDNAMSYRTFQRINGGYPVKKGSYLYQICTGLGVTLRELKEGVEDEKSYILTTFKKSSTHDQYIYNDYAFAKIYSTPKIDFLALELTLSPGGKTAPEQDPADINAFKKWVYVVMGKIICFIGDRKEILKKGEALIIDSTVPHSFANTSQRKAIAIIIQHPRHI